MIFLRFFSLRSYCHQALLAEAIEQSFGRAFSKARGLSGQRPDSPSADGEILWNLKRVFSFDSFLFRKRKREKNIKMNKSVFEFFILIKIFRHLRDGRYVTLRVTRYNFCIRKNFDIFAPHTVQIRYFAASGEKRYRTIILYNIPAPV